MTDPSRRLPPRFFRVGCTHTKLFRESYIRCYQNHGFKVIRCFPHCCPHTEQRGCGASLSLGLPVDPSMPRTQLFAYGRFDVASDDTPTFAAGATLPWQGFADDARRPGHALATWIVGRADPSRDHEVVSYSLLISYVSKIVFHFNENRARGWHYGWQGSASTKKRHARHRFQVGRHMRSLLVTIPTQVYVVHRVSETECVVIDVAASPPFSMSSYRRASAPASIRDDVSSDPPTTPKPLLMSFASPPMSQIQQQARQLWLVVQVCHSISMDDVAAQWDSVEQQLLACCYKHVGEDIAGQKLTRILILHWTGAPTKIPQRSVASRLTNTALAVMLHWYDSDVLNSIHEFISNNDHAIEQVSALHESYNRVIEFLHNWFIQMLPTDVTMNAFMTDILTSLTNKIPQNTQNHAIGFDAIVRILEESFKKKSSNLPDTIIRDTTRGLNGVWMMSELNIQTLDCQSSLSSFVQYFTMSFGLNMRFDETSGNVHVKAVISLLPATWTSFQLNGQPNELQVLPNGLSCGWGALSTVDYVGWMDPFQTISLLIYAWPKPSIEPRSAYHFRLQVTPDIRNMSKMRVSMIVEMAALDANIDALDAGKWTLHIAVRVAQAIL
ncbi:Aste57867_2079 [Aphanomyces stellatus]|uniref:Aste57867_2079 protein n=1 Tax=Aphanomyces stellatus TaxID=120398 RepID=A0A485K9A9_9STRA|nr:hypothetical protein As57867_002075 [Aphanomyces stellatus]VFT79282.1 Aste57867_2079 [Aphanomyces stellatus]